MVEKQKITIKDVATRAGVSVGTVSRVLAQNGTVKRNILERVQKAISELSYRPNLAAQALRANRVNVIGLIIPDITNPFFAQLANELERLASEQGHALILSSSHNDPALEARQLAAILEHKPRAVLLVPAADEQFFTPPAASMLLALDRRMNGTPSVTTNQQASAALAVDHLVSLGHRRIAYIAGPTQTVTAREREEGFLAHVLRLQETGVAIIADVFRGKFDFESGERIAREVLSRPESERATAIAAASDQQAIGAVRAARDMGLRVPQDVSIIGFDDIVLAHLIVPRLTTVRQPVTQMAEAAMNQIFDPHGSGGDKSFMGELVLRDSTARPRKGGAAPLRPVSDHVET
jgi:LacI family transcriptional regulator